MALDIREHVSLKGFTTLAVGGFAKYFVEVKSEEETLEALAFAEIHRAPIFILGGGSNILVSDQGFPGIVAHNKILGVASRVEGKEVFVTLGAGEEWDAVVRRAVEENLAGIECLSGIPGSAGGAVVQNAGAYGQSMDAVVQEVRAVHIPEKKVEVFDRTRCGFEYRDSFFKKHTGEYCITHVTLRLTPGGDATLAYHDIKSYFASEKKPTLKDVRNAVIAIRARKGYVIMSGYECDKTAGSFCKNPVVSEEKFKKVKDAVRKEQSRGGCREPWYWSVSPALVKISAACLIERAGFRKGYQEGSVGISSKHPLSLVNFGGGTAREIAALSYKISREVKDRFGVELAEEIVRVP